jgi:hypothetical protein
MTDALRSASVIYAILCGYGVGWLVTTIVLAVMIRELNDPVRPQPRPIHAAVAAGAAWPVVILGATQIAIVALVMNAARWRTHRDRSAGDQFDDEVPEQRTSTTDDPPSAQMPCGHGGVTVTQ